MTPPQPNIADPRAEIEAIFAHERMSTHEVAEHTPRRGMEEPRLSVQTKHFIKPHIAGEITELELIEQAKSHAPDPEKSKYEHLEQIALVSLYIDHLRNNNVPEKDGGFFKKTARLLTGSSTRLSAKPTRRELIQHESEIGGHLFGAIPEGHHRQFFNLDPVTWIWYEEWPDGKNKSESKTTRYEVHENGILKVQEGAPYYFIEGQELSNLLAATRMYYERIARDVYNFDAATGKPLHA